MNSITRKMSVGLTTFAMAGLIAGYAQASSEHGDLSVGSTDDGSGNLITEYNFDKVLRTDFSAEVGSVVVYSATTPGIGAAESEAPDLYELAIGTTVEMAVINIVGIRTPMLRRIG